MGYIDKSMMIIIVVYITIRKLRYFCHIKKSNKDTIRRRICDDWARRRHNCRTRKRGRPKISWLDGITMWNDLAGFNLLSSVQTSEQRTVDMPEWHLSVAPAISLHKYHTGCHLPVCTANRSHRRDIFYFLQKSCKCYN